MTIALISVKLFISKAGYRKQVRGSKKMPKALVVKEKKITSEKQLIDSQNSLKTLGAIHVCNSVSWDCVNDFSLAYDDFAAIAAKYGLENYLPEPKKPRTAFKDAVKYTKKPRGLLVQELKKASSEYIVLGMYQQSVTGHDNNALLEVQHDINVLFHKENNQLTLICNAASEELEGMAESYFNDLHTCYKQYLHASVRDLNDVLRNFCCTHGIRTQKKGGSYYIPAKFNDKCEKIIEFVKEVSAGSDFLSVPFYCHPSYVSGNSGVNSVSRMAKKALLSELQALDKEIFSYTLRKETYEILIEALEEAIKCLPNRSDCFEYLEAIKPAITDLMAEEIDQIIQGNLPNPELAAEIEIFKAAIPFKESETREKSYVARLEELNTVAEKAINFEKYLEDAGTKVNNTIARLNKEITDFISG